MEHMSTMEEGPAPHPPSEAATGLEGLPRAAEQAEEVPPPPQPPIEWPRFGDYAGFRVAVVVTAWNRECSNQLLEGCEAVLRSAQCEVSVVEVPGALDLVAGCRAAARGGAGAA